MKVSIKNSVMMLAATTVMGLASQAIACQQFAQTTACDYYLNDARAHANCLRILQAGIQLGGVGVLQNGNLLMVGGVDSSGNKTIYTSKRAFIYDVQSKTLCETAQMNTGRNQQIPVATMADGNALVSGGWTSYGATKNAEIFNPLNETWTSVGSLPFALYDHSVALQSDGNLLVTGGLIPNKGRNNGATANTSTILFDSIRRVFLVQ